MWEWERRSVAVDQQPDKKTDAGSDADAGPRMLVDIVIRCTGRLLAIFDYNDLDMPGLFPGFLQPCQCSLVESGRFIFGYAAGIACGSSAPDC